MTSLFHANSHHYSRVFSCVRGQLQLNPHECFTWSDSHQQRVTIQMTPQPKGIAPPEDVRAAVAALIDEVGERLAAERIEMSIQSVVRIALGRPIHRSTVGWVRLRLGLPVPPAELAGTSS